jgi:steroid delta-isomerase-like uncharacterized protein
MPRDYLPEETGREERSMEGTTKADAKLEPDFVEDWSRRYLEAWNSLDADGIAALCIEDVAWNDPGLPEPAHGRDGVREFVRVTGHAFADFHVEELGRPYVSEGEPRVLGRYRMTGKMLGAWEYTNLAPTGRRFDVLGVDEWTLSDGLLSQYETYYDSVDMARQLGILPPVGGAMDRAMAGLQHLRARFQRGRPS